MFSKSETTLCGSCFAEGKLGPIQLVRDADGVPVKNENERNHKFSYTCAVCKKIMDPKDTVLTMDAAIMVLWACIATTNTDVLKEAAKALLTILDENEAKQKAEEEANPKLKLSNSLRRMLGSL